MQTDVGEFIAARSDRLLRTAYLLTGDREEAEHLLQAALAAVWSSWSRSDLGPDLTARRELVRGLGPWWRPRPHPAEVDDDEVLAALDRLPRRQRAALVLSEGEGLSDKELAEVLDCSELSAGRLVERGRAAFGALDAGAALESVADRVETDTTVAQRLGHVERRVGRRRRWRRAEVLATLGVAAVVAVVIFLLVPHDGGESPSPSPPQPLPRQVKPLPPLLEGQRLPSVLPVNGVGYRFDRSAQSSPGDRELRVVVPASGMSAALAWVTPPTTHGPISVIVDGNLVARTRPGRLASGILLTPYGQHVVVMRGSPLPGTRLGLAVYRWPSS
jgi:DNA-directed RNA polymerase specialized sigma24 family protein